MRLQPLLLAALCALAVTSAEAATITPPPVAAGADTVIAVGDRCGPHHHWVRAHRSPRNGHWIKAHCAHDHHH